MSWALLFAHHEGPALRRCWRIGRGPGVFHLCARCSGLLPALLFGLAAQRLWLPPPGRFDLAVELALIWPALWDYARGVHRPGLGTNLGRAAAGLMLGLGLSRLALLGRIQGFGTPAVLFPILLCLSWVLLAPGLWPRPEFEPPPAAGAPDVQLTDGAPNASGLVSSDREV